MTKSVRQDVVEANSVVAPVAASNLDAKAPAFVFASTSFLPNSKRGPQFPLVLTEP